MPLQRRTHARCTWPAVLAVLLGCTLTVPAASSSDTLPDDRYVVKNYAIEEPLTDVPGDAARGAAIMIDREGGNCLGCHAAPVDAEFFGTTGPDLNGVGSRLSAAQIRLRLVNPKVLNPMTMMPAYYKTAGLHRVRPDFTGKPVLTAQQIEDIVTFLSKLK